MNDRKMGIDPSEAFAGGGAGDLEDRHGIVLDSGDGEVWSNAEDTKLPPEKALIRPFAWKVLVMPLHRTAKTAGGIIIPYTAQAADAYLNYVGRIVAVGPLAYKHRKFSDMGMKPEDAYKRGDVVLYPVYQYQRVDFKGTKLILLNDDSFLGRVPEGVSPWDFKLER